MKCPLTYKEGLKYYNGTTYGAQDCMKEECAWWSKSFELCDFNILTQELYELKEVMKDIRDKMPHAEQFKR